MRAWKQDFSWSPAELLTVRVFFLHSVVKMRLAQSLGEFEQVVLLATLRLDDNAYGVTISSEISACTGREPSIPSRARGW